jgi:glycosyltransferase involved in cell wall biosynthesis
MHIVFFTHPTFQAHQSMPRYAHWLLKGMKERGHTVELWSADPRFFKLPVPASLKKWLGYIDQFIVFPGWVRKKIKQYPADTLFVFTDHALGPWVPLVAARRHVIHCHDFLAQRSAAGELPQNPTGWTGRKYQAFIKRGYCSGKNFICISQKTREDLLRFLPREPQMMEVVYNAVNTLYKKVDTEKALNALQSQPELSLSNGYILHVGGNQWYKNRLGVIRIYEQWRQTYSQNLPLLLVGEKPTPEIEALRQSSPYRQDIHFLINLADQDVLHAYNTATLFLFPSLAEGFGWPIAEAMACGCMVITTGEAPMTEVGGEAATYLPPMPTDGAQLPGWLQMAAATLQRILELSQEAKTQKQANGLENVKRFDSEKQLNKMARLYEQVH